MNSTTTRTVLRLCPGLPGWTSIRRNTHSHLSWSSTIPFQLAPSTIPLNCQICHRAEF